MSVPAHAQESYKCSDMHVLENANSVFVRSSQGVKSTVETIFQPEISKFSLIFQLWKLWVAIESEAATCFLEDAIAKCRHQRGKRVLAELSVQSSFKGLLERLLEKWVLIRKQAPRCEKVRGWRSKTYFLHYPAKPSPFLPATRLHNMFECNLTKLFLFTVVTRGRQKLAVCDVRERLCSIPIQECMIKNGLQAVQESLSSTVYFTWLLYFICLLVPFGSQRYLGEFWEKKSIMFDENAQIN